MKRLFDVALTVLLASLPVFATAGGARLRVQVLSGGKSAVGAGVVVFCRGKGGERDVLARGTTDAHGMARLDTEQAPSGGCMVWAGGVAGAGVAWAPAGPGPVRLVLPPAVTVRLKAVDARSGRALSYRGVKVTADLDLPRGRGRIRVPSGLVTLTGGTPDAAWEIGGIPRIPGGRVTLRLRAAGYASLRFRDLSLREKAINLGAVELRSTGAVCGVVRGLIHGATTVVHLQPVGGGLAVTVRPMQDGTFCEKDLASGVKYDVWASSLYGESESQRVVPPFQGVVLDMPQPRRVSGRVVDADDEAVDRFAVTVRPSALTAAPELAGRFPGLTVHREVEDAEGRFDVVVPTELEAQARIEAEGFAPQTLEVPRGESLEDAVVRLEPGLSLRGLVIGSENGEPVSGASVVAWCGGESVGVATTSGDDGQFQLTDLSPGSCRVEASAPGFSPSSRSMDVSKEGSPGDLRLELDRAVAICGRVVDGQTGAPVAGARLAAVPEVSGGDNPAGGTAAAGLNMVSGPDGRFCIEGCARGKRYGLKVSAESYVPMWLTAVAEEGAPPVRVELETGITLNGLVRGFQGDGAGLHVLLQQGARLLSAVTAYGGFFRIEGVPAGEVTFWVLGPTGRSGPCSGRFQIPPATKTVHEDLDCRKGVVSLSGTLRTPAGVPAGSVPLLLESTGREPAIYQATTGADGSFRFPGISPGSYRLRALPASHRVVVVWQGDVPHDMVVILVLTASG